MKNTITIPKYNDNLELIDNLQYEITYGYTKLPQNLRIFVNNYQSSYIINLLDHNQGYKKQLLKAISEYKNGLLTKNNNNIRISVEKFNQLYSKKIKQRVNNYLLPINIENSRDELTKYKLI